MKKIIFILLLCIMSGSISCLALEQNPDTSEWFVWDMPDERQAVGTAIDASFMLDAPAGKYGFTKGNGEYIGFVAENGETTPARFWGTNISTTSMFDEYEDLENLAMRIARSGYNLVRFHAPDLNTDGNNIFNQKNGTKSTKQIDKDQLDKIFYLFSLLKEKGVYIYMDLMAYRPVLENDGALSLGNLTTEACFDEEIIQLQMEYARQLLTTVNPYTGLAMIDDPALAFLQIHNENGLTELTAGSYRNEKVYQTEYYAGQLNEKFRAWLKDKYKTDSKLAAAWIQEEKTGLTAGETLENIVFDYTYAKSEAYSAERIADHNRFVYDVQGEMYKRMVEYLRSMGAKCLITGTSLGLGAQNTVTTAVCEEFTDFVDVHSYNSHPSNWFSAGSQFGGFGSSAGRGVNLFWRCGFYRGEKPYIIGEYQSCLPNPYGAETEPMMAVIASFQNWYPMNYNLKSDSSEAEMINDAFQTYNSRARTAMQPSAAIIYHRHDVKEAEKALEIPITRDDIITGNHKPWPQVGKIQFGLYTDYMKARYKIYATKEEYDAADKSEYEERAAEATGRVNNNETVINDQIIWERDNSLMKVTTDYTNMIAGDISGVLYESDVMKFESDNEAATVTLVSLDDKALKNSEHMLLTAAARERNTDMEMSEETTGLMVSTGKAPILTEAVRADVIIKTSSPIAVYALDSSGRKKQAVAIEKVSGGYSFKPSAAYETLYYEIVKINEGVVFAESDIFTGNVTVSGFCRNPGETVNVRIETPSGKSFSAFSKTADSSGYFEREYVLAEELERGIYTVSATFADTTATDTFRYERPELCVPVKSADKKYIHFSEGIEIIDANGELGAAVSADKNSITATTDGGAYNISFDNTVMPYEFKTLCSNISQSFAETAYIEMDIDVGEAEGTPVLSFRRGYDILRLDISDYMAGNGMQTVKIPLADFAKCADYDFGRGEYYIGIGFDRHTAATVKIKNMRLGLQIEENAEYYYKDENTVKIVENGICADTVAVIADTSTQSKATVTRNYTEDGRTCIKLQFAGEQSAVKFGHTKNLNFENITADGSFVLAMRVKAAGDTSGVSFVKTTGGFTGGTESIISAGMYFAKASEGWQNVFIPITEDLNGAYGIGFSSGELTMYIDSMYIIPANGKAYSKIAQERIFKTEKILFGNGKFGCDYIKYPAPAEAYPDISLRNISGQYGTNTIYMVCNGRQGFEFDITDFGITQENYKNKYLKFDIRNISTAAKSVIVGRKGTDLYESVTANYGEGWQTVVVPLEAFSTVSALSWDDTKSIYICMGDHVWWKTYEMDNIMIGSYIDGEFSEFCRITDSGSIEIQMKNTMNAAYEYAQKGINIIAVKKDGKLKSIKTEEAVNAEIIGEMTAEIAKAEAESGETVEWYRWESLSQLTPHKSKLYKVMD